MGEEKSYRTVVGIIIGVLAGSIVGITPYLIDHLSGTVPFIQKSPPRIEQDHFKSPHDQAQAMLQRLRTETQRLNSQVTHLEQTIKEHEIMLRLLKVRGLDESSEEYASVVKAIQHLREQASKTHEAIQNSGQMEKQLSALLADDSTEVTSTLQEQERIIRQAGMLLEGLDKDTGSTIRQSDWDKSLGQ